MALFTWRGWEEPLDSVRAVATELVVNSVVDHGVSRYAEGTMKGRDYVERGIEFSNPWEAFGTLKGNHWLWLPRRVEDKTVFWRDPESKKACFTMSDQINGGIGAFISVKLAMCSWGIWTDLQVDDVVMEPMEYAGGQRRYNGNCVCESLSTCSVSNPFPWQELTGGEFPERCFACSCGRWWWRPAQEKHLWYMVTDPEAWTLLLKYDGVPTRMMSSIDGEEGLFLVQTLCNTGLIPLW